MDKLIEKVNLIYNDELINGNKTIIVGNDQAEMVVGSKSIDGMEPFINIPETYSISTRNIDLLLKLYQKADHLEKDIIFNDICKIFDQSNNYYSSLCYFAFSMLFLFDKDKSLSMLKEYFVLNGSYSLTIHILNLILTYKYEYFTDADLETVKSLVNIVKSKIASYSGSRAAPEFKSMKEKRAFFNYDWFKQKDVLKKGLFPRTLKRIHQIEYHRLGKFLEGINPELNSDKIALINRMDELGFPEDAKRCLDEIDKIYFGSPDKFECKSCMGFIRSFLEEIFRELVQGMSKITTTPYESESDKFSNRKRYLLRVAFINDDEAEFYQRYYNLVSNEGIHSLTSKREYVRISRNVVIELGLLLLNRYNEYRKDS